MSTEESFLEAIAARPEDVTARLVFADWLEEQGDPRCSEIRASCRFRLSVSFAERKHLDHIVVARSQADGQAVSLGSSVQNPTWQISNGAAFARDVSAVSSPLVEQNFPRDRTGQFALGSMVLLSEHPCSDRLPRGRRLWLAAKGPGRRKDPQRITIEIEPLIEDNAQYHWGEAPWMWRTDQDTDPFASFPIPTWDIVGGNANGPVDALKTAFVNALGAEQGTFALCTLLQDEGRFEDALRVCGVSFNSDLTRLLNAETFALEGGCDCMHGDAAIPRATHLREHLWESAPWRFTAALEAGRGGKLLILPRQRHSRKASLILSGSPDAPTLFFDFTASNRRVPDSLWKRPVEIDIARFCSTKQPENRNTW